MTTCHKHCILVLCNTTDPSYTVPGVSWLYYTHLNSYSLVIGLQVEKFHKDKFKKSNTETASSGKDTEHPQSDSEREASK